MKTAALPDISEVLGTTDDQRGWIDTPDLRQRAADALPTVLTRELWKYTPLRGFLDAVAGAATQSPAATLVNADQSGIRATAFDALDDEQQARVRSTLSQAIEAGRHPVAELSLLRARGGWLVEVSGEPAEPLEIRYPGQGIVPVVVLLQANAALTLVERLDTDGFLAQVTHADVGAGARLTHHRAALQRDVAHYALLNVRLDRDAEYRLNTSLVGGNRRRGETHVMLDGPGAYADLSGAYVVEQGQHLDQQLVVEHRHGHTTSRQKFHGIGAGKGRSVFNGRIHIHRDAPQSDAQLSNKNLALSPEAEMNTKPELEIYTDDVRCAHGATVGQMSEEALFYLSARGIPAAEAKRLLAYGFVRECLDGPLTDSAVARFREALS
jgi:Fe-S cluster assembly protein SufD